jgi:hypothetical protein
VTKKRGNPNWGKPELNTVPYTGATSFEEVAKRLCPVPSAVRQLSSAQGLGPKEQGSQIRAIKLARIVGS